MTQDELLLLERGRVPALPIIEAVTRYAIENGERVTGDRLGLDLQPLIVVAERAGVPYSTLCTWVGDPMRTSSLPFGVADELLCACDLYHLWWGELNDYYEHVDLTWRLCDCPGCEVWFKPVRDASGATAPRYCSKACRTSAAKQREGTTTSRRKKYNGTRMTCRNGHRKTPENTKIHHGREECSECAREAARRHWAKHPVLATHCKHGHEFTPDNTMTLKNGKRRCRTCNNATSAQGYHRRRQQPVAA